MSKKREISIRAAREATGLSLREAAEKLGITHPYLSGLERGHKRLGEKYQKAMAKLYGVAEASLSQPLSHENREFELWQKNLLHWWDSRFLLPAFPSVSRRLKDLFISPTFQSPEGEALDAQDLVKEFLTRTKNEILVLDGEMGSGKSMFLRMLVADPSAISKTSDLSGRVVFYVAAKDLEVQRLPLATLLCKFYASAGYTGSLVQLESYIEKAIERGAGLILIDGIDEVQPATSRVQLLASLEQQFRDTIQKSGTKIIIAGQPTAFLSVSPSSPYFYRRHVALWSQGQILSACREWEWSSPETFRQFWLLIKANRTLYRLCRWPVLFHLFATLFQHSGLQSLRASVGLCEACCDVLEHNWSTARKSLESTSRDLDESSKFGWIRWRQFFVYLMKQELLRARTNDEAPSFAFSERQLMEAWRAFLVRKGLSEDSIEFDKLEFFVRSRSFLGPLIQRVQSGSKYLATSDCGERSQLSPTLHYEFLDPLLGEFYLGVALTQDIDLMRQIIVSHLRDPFYEEIITLALQKLGKSESIDDYEHFHKFLEFISACDDDCKLEHRQIGNYGLFITVAAIVDQPVEAFWDSHLKPWLDYFFSTNYERDCALSFALLSEYSTSREMRKYFREKYAEFRNTSREYEPNAGLRWRYAGALAALGDSTEEIASHLEEEFVLLTRSPEKLTSSDRVHARRIVWTLRQIGHVFESESNQKDAPASDSIYRIRVVTSDFVKAVADRFEVQLRRQDVHTDSKVWSVLISTIQSFAALDYRQELEQMAERFFVITAKHWKYIRHDYQARTEFFQFLKSLIIHSQAFRSKKKDAFLAAIASSSVTANKGTLGDIELREVEVLLRYAGNPSLSRSEAWAEILGVESEKLFSQCVASIASQGPKVANNFLPIAQAACALQALARDGYKNGPQHNFKKAVLVLQACLQAEHSLELSEMEEGRCYTDPFTGEGFPLYDHLYNCLVELARELPLK
jgi:transcriptional regulator with XRE-family HTH domain